MSKTGTKLCSKTRLTFGRKLLLVLARAVDCELLERDAQCEAVKCVDLGDLEERFVGASERLMSRTRERRASDH
jgi:hypothetical protein